MLYEKTSSQIIQAAAARKQFRQKLWKGYKVHNTLGFGFLYRNVTIMSAYDHQKVPKNRTFFDLKADILHKFRYRRSIWEIYDDWM